MDLANDAPLWTPTPDRIARSAITSFIHRINGQHGTNLRLGLFGTARTYDEEAVVLEVDGEQLLDCRLIFNDQNGRIHLPFSLPEWRISRPSAM